MSSLKWWFEYVKKKIALRPNKIEITVLRPARICFEVAALPILSKFQLKKKVGNAITYPEKKNPHSVLDSRAFTFGVMALAIMDRVPVYDKSVKRLYICIASRMLSKFLHSMIFRMAETMCQRRSSTTCVNNCFRCRYCHSKSTLYNGQIQVLLRRLYLWLSPDRIQFWSYLSKHTPSCFEVSPGKSNFPNQICLTSQLRRDREKYSRLNMPR